jgi:hypothetical protein
MPEPQSTTPFRARLPIVVVGAAIFVVLLIVTAITENNALGTIVAVYGIVGGILLGRLLAASDPERIPENDAPAPANAAVSPPSESGE